MRIPYLQRVGAGLHIGSRVVRWVELERSFGRVRLRRHEVEPVVGDQREAALERLVARLHPVLPVVSHLDPEHVRTEFVEAPAFDDPEDLSTWLRGRPSPPGGLQNQTEFVLRASVVSGEPEDGAVCSVATARTQAIEERVALLRRVGLVPERLATGVLEAGSALTLGQDVEPERLLLVVEPEGATLTLLREGRPVRAETFEAISPEDVLEEARMQLHLWDLAPQPLYVTGLLAGAVQACHARTDTSLQGGALDIHLARPGTSATADEESGAEMTIAFALAAESVFPGLALVDFLDDRRIAEAVEVRDRLEGQRAILILGGLILGLLLLATGARMVLSTEIERAEAVLLEHVEELNRLDETRGRVERLKMDLAAGRALVSERTQTAMWLEALGRTVPVGVRLTELRLESGDRGPTAALTGLAETDDDVSAYVSALERLGVTTSIRLLFSERLSVRDADRLSGSRTRAMTRFALEAELRRTSSPPESAPDYSP